MCVCVCVCVRVRVCVCVKVSKPSACTPRDLRMHMLSTRALWLNVTATNRAINTHTHIHSPIVPWLVWCQYSPSSLFLSEKTMAQHSDHISNILPIKLLPSSLTNPLMKRLTEYAHEVCVCMCITCAVHVCVT